MKKLIEQVQSWAKERGLLKYEYAETQYLKYLEEVGETARAILKKDEAAIIDGFGDIAVTIIILAKQLDSELIINFKNPDHMRTFDWFMDEIEYYSVNPNSLDYLNDVSSAYGYSLESCLESAWNEIKDRKGKTQDGHFVKE